MVINCFSNAGKDKTANYSKIESFQSKSNLNI